MDPILLLVVAAIVAAAFGAVIASFLRVSGSGRGVCIPG